MSYTELNASNYKYSGVFYNAEFEDLLSKIIACYRLMQADNIRLINDENTIRNELLIKYLHNNEIRKKIGLLNYLFNREVPEDNNTGRTDIKIETLNTFQDTAAYYIIECKRLDTTNLNGTTGLNAKYIENGIYRFVSNYYTAHYKTNGMIGFVVENLDIDQNIENINYLLTNSFGNANTISPISKFNLVPGFEYSYSSKHVGEMNEIVIYHLMLDFSSNIKNRKIN